MRPRK